ncbi:MAG: carboxypeptidase-like regulatory domain-containing protein [Anaeromyxobacter sp.]
MFDLSTAAGIAGAQVLATDENGAPIGAPVTSKSDGAYSMRVPATRTNSKGALAAKKVLLRSQAKNYVPFPSGARISLPIDLTNATRGSESEAWVLSSELTGIGLNPVSASEQGLPTVSGSIESGAATLVVLEQGTARGRSTLAAPDGTFSFFNVPPGDATISAYRRNQNYSPATVTVADVDVTGVRLERAAAVPASLSGSVQLVAGANGDGTSVVLAVESTFIEALGRGEVPPGLRAPGTGAPNITGAWLITGIPDGRYVVLAAFENDDNVRDPDQGIAGTDLVHIVVTGGTLTGASSTQFKVTGAVKIVSPGAENIDEVTATPTFSWKKYSNADAYTLKVFDALGVLIWAFEIPDGGTTTADYVGPALATGQTYQWRLIANRNGGPTSFTEELRGLFIVR